MGLWIELMGCCHLSFDTLLMWQQWEFECRSWPRAPYSPAHPTRCATLKPSFHIRLSTVRLGCAAPPVPTLPDRPTRHPNTSRSALGGSLASELAQRSWALGRGEPQRRAQKDAAVFCLSLAILQCELPGARSPLCLHRAATCRGTRPGLGTAGQSSPGPGARPLKPGPLAPSRTLPSPNPRHACAALPVAESEQRGAVMTSGPAAMFVKR